MKRRYLVTGAQGLAGRSLTARILSAEPDSEVLGIGRSRRLDGFGARYQYEPVALHETQKLRALAREFQPQCVFHLAAALHSAAERDLLETNIAGTASLVDALDEVRPLLVLGSSASVYGGTSALPVRESDPCTPATLYGVSKLAAEHVARVKASRSGVPMVVARIFNVIGPGQDDTHVCGRLARRLAALAGVPRPVLETGPLGATRDFIDVRDLARALLLLARRGEPGETYNVGSGRETRIRDLLAVLIRISGLDVQVVEGNLVTAGVARQVAEVSRLVRLGFEVEVPLVQSLTDVFHSCR